MRAAGMYSKKFIIDLDTLIISLLCLFILFNTLGGIFLLQTGGSLLWESLIGVSRLSIFFISFIYIIYYYCRKNVVQPVVITVFLYLLYIVVVSVSFFFPPYIPFLINAFPWPLMFISFYLYSLKKECFSFLRKFLLLSFPICIIATLPTVLTRGQLGTNTGTVYYSVAYLPLILLLCKDKEKKIFSVLTILLVLLSLKRAGVITIILGFSLYYLCFTHLLKSASLRIKSILVVMIMVALLSGVLYIFFDSYMLDIYSRFVNIDRDQGSGRLFIWQMILVNFINSSPMNQLLGHGFHAVPYVLRPLGNTIYAHNSYIEFLYDLGIIGVLWLVIMELFLCYNLMRMIKEKNIMAPSCIFAICVVLIFSSVSYFFDESGTILPLSLFWGIVLGTYKRHQKQNYSSAHGKSACFVN